MSGKFYEEARSLLKKGYSRYELYQIIDIVFSVIGEEDSIPAEQIQNTHLKFSEFFDEQMNLKREEQREEERREIIQRNVGCFGGVFSHALSNLNKDQLEEPEGDNS